MFVNLPSTNLGLPCFLLLSPLLFRCLCALFLQLLFRRTIPKQPSRRHAWWQCWWDWLRYGAWYCLAAILLLKLLKQHGLPTPILLEDDIHVSQLRRIVASVQIHELLPTQAMDTLLLRGWPGGSGCEERRLRHLRLSWREKRLLRRLRVRLLLLHQRDELLQHSLDVVHLARDCLDLRVHARDLSGDAHLAVGRRCGGTLIGLGHHLQIGLKLVQSQCTA